MVNIQTIVEWGLRCPSCDSKNIRACYHDYTFLDSFICNSCGLRWLEDIDFDNFEESLQRKLRNYKDNMGERFIWVLHIAKEPDHALKNASSVDGQELKDFIKEGLSWIKRRFILDKDF